MTADKRRTGIALLAGVALLAVAIPVLAASPSPSASDATAAPAASAAPDTTSPSPSASHATTAPSPTAAPATTAPAASPEATTAPVKPDATPDETAKPDRTEKPDKGPESAISLKGTVDKAVDGQGRPAYTMTVGGTTWELSAGPPWFWGDRNPLNAFVGKSVTVAGTTRSGEAEIDVETVDGTALRAPGKPPWAGGPWVVGSSHPGWKDWMADGKPGKGLGRDSAPGQLKKASSAS